MEVFDRDWCHLYCWTENGSAIYRYSRHAEYFGLMHESLAEFWWQVSGPPPRRARPDEP